MRNKAGFFETWYIDPQKDLAMAATHGPYWRHFIECCCDGDLSGKTVMDFGCHRGGFLKLLHEMRGYSDGIGIDIALEPIRAAEAEKQGLPLRFHATHDLSGFAATTDCAFSYEVIYLLPDLAQHARDMFNVLKPGGVYYALTAFHSESPMLEFWRKSITENCNAQVHAHSPDDYAQAFANAGFEVGVKRFRFDGYVSFAKASAFYPSITSAIDNHSENKLVFRMEKPNPADMDVS